MDPRLQIIHHLYGDAESRPALPDELEADPALRAEHRALSEVKFCLDHRRRARPDAAVLDRIVAHAVAAPAPVVPGEPRPDRPPRAHRRYRRALLALVTGCVVAAGVGLTLFTSPEPPRRAAQASPPTLVLPPLDDPASRISTLEAYARAQQEAVLDWDDGADVRTLQRRIDLLDARSAGGTVPTRLEP